MWGGGLAPTRARSGRLQQLGVIPPPPIPLFQSTTPPPSKTLQIPPKLATLTYNTVHRYASRAILAVLSIQMFRRREDTMNQTATQPLTTLELKTATQASTNIHSFSVLSPLDTSTIPTFTELLAEYQASIDRPAVAWSDLCPDELADPIALSQTNLANAHPQPVNWLWQKRLPLAGITLLDGDHGCGKSLLALQLAACVSSATTMPDGSTTIPGGVVIVSPMNSATTTQLLTALGADLSHIKILSCIQEPETSSHTSSQRPFSIPEDFTRLLHAIKQVDARLVILDPFISLLSRNKRWTDQRLGHLLTDLNQHLIEHNVACLLIRNCPARGGHARPSVLERSDHFEILAASRLLLTPDPLQPNHLLLAHAKNRHAILTPTLTLQIRSDESNPDFPYITILGSHRVQARDLINYRPDTLHRQLLFQHLLQIITATTDTIPVSTLYTLSPYSSAFQIQRSLSDLLHMGQIERPARGFYTLTPTTPISPLKSSAATSPEQSQNINLKSSAATSPEQSQDNNFKSSAATSPEQSQDNNFKSSAATSPEQSQDNNFKSSAATSPEQSQDNNFKSSAATSPEQSQANNFKSSAATSPEQSQDNNFKSSAATSPEQSQALNFKSSAATSPEQSQALFQIISCNKSRAITGQFQIISCNKSRAITG